MNIKILKEKIKNREIVFCIMGLGYVGLPLAEVLLKKGFKVIGYDISKERVKMLNSGKCYVEDVSEEIIKNSLKKGIFRAFYDEKILKKADCIFICVPTPVNENKVPDLSYVISAAEKIKRNRKDEQIIILKSTTFPETTEKIILNILEDENFKEGKNFYLGFVPERVNPGDKIFKIDNTPAVVSGVSKKSLHLIKEIYLNITSEVFPVSSPKVAEMTKLLENIFRNINIALVNELAILCERMKIDIWEVISAASTKPFGFMPFYPGPGVGGHCIPVDPYYLSYKAWEYDTPLEFINLAARINESMPYYTSQRILSILNEKNILSKNAKVLIFGVAFKKDVGDIRHSPSLKVMELLFDKVKKISYIDPYIPEIYLKNKKLKSLKFSPQTIRKYDISIILTDHSIFKKEIILENSKIIFDARGFFKDIKSSKIYKLGSP